MRIDTALPIALLAALAAHVPVFTRAQETTFRVRLENVSAGSALPGPFAPGVWAIHSTPGALFDIGSPGGGSALEPLAEDGDPMPLAAAVAGRDGVASSGAFAVPEGADGPGPLFPGAAYEFVVTADPTAPYLSFATMLVRSNDLFAAPPPAGVRLFAEDGSPLAARVLGGEVTFWNAGSEHDQAPGLGPDQAPLQGEPDTGPAEGVVSLFSSGTRTLPLPTRIAGIALEARDGRLHVRVTNVSASSGAIVTPIAPVFFATHDHDWRLFEVGQDASPGLEMLAEDGGPGGLVGEHTGALGVGEIGAQPITDERPEDAPGPAFPGESYSFDVAFDASAPYLTIAAMVVESNDVFLAFSPAGIAIVGGDGQPRAIEDIQADFERDLAVWDAGTEVNQVPGVGGDQAIRQSAPDTGADDPRSGVRLYDDAVNDLDGPLGGGFASIDARRDESGMWTITVANASGGAFPGLLAPVAWAVHSPEARMFQAGERASDDLERLAEDGDPMGLVTALAMSDAVGSSGAAAVPDGADAPGPIASGGSYTFSVMPTAEHAYLSLATMVVPSNDTFLAFGPAGVRLVDEAGMPRGANEVVAEMRAELVAWDAGTERNQAGAAGPDQAPRQSGPDTGADEGSGLVRELDDPVWSVPAASGLLRVTIVPEGSNVAFRRGDTNADGRIDMSDPMFALMYLFLGGARPGCLDALDADDDGRLNVTDPVVILEFLFRGGSAPPGSDACAFDETEDRFGCEVFAPCA